MILDIQKINLTQICHEILLEFYNLLEKENFRVEIHIKDKPLYANADADAISRILKNLIDNAIKYGSSGKFLGLSLYEKNNHIFTRTYTVDRKKGNGLGLAISQGLASSMGGSISVFSIPRKKQYLQSDYKVRKKLESNKKKENFILYTFFRKEAA